MKKILVITGPTSTGKTDLALFMAKKLNGELICADSRQVYKELDIGTGKLPNSYLKVTKANGWWQIDGVKIQMYDLISPKKQFTVADYINNVAKILEKLQNKGKLPIIVGGTGFYIKAITEGIPNLSIPVDQKQRRELEKLSLDQLQKKLKKLSSLRWDSLNNSDKQNPRRLLRSIELISMNPYIGQHSHINKLINANFLKIGLTAPREVLYKNADMRILSRLNQGLIKEAEQLYSSGLSFKRMRQLGLEYGVLANYLEKKIPSLDEFIKILQGKTHNYIRRQLTWFKKDKQIIWFDITEKKYREKIEKRVIQWYDEDNESKS
jgi:tRNA dimethylallyltransferase